MLRFWGGWGSGDLGKSYLIINQYASTLKTGFGGRSYYIGKELVKRGNSVTLVSGDTAHIFRQAQRNQYKFETTITGGLQHLKIRLMHYNTARSFKRILNWFLFCWRLLFIGRYLKCSPDIVIVSSPQIFAVLSGWFLSWKYKARFVFEIRDIWPLTIMELGGYSHYHPLILLMSLSEWFALTYSYKVIGVSALGTRYLSERGYDHSKYIHIPNGYSEEEYKQAVPSSIVDDFPKDRLIVGYLGTFGVANALDTLISAAKIIDDNSKIAFVLVGQGGEKEALKAQAGKLLGRSIFIFDSIPKAEIYSVLKSFDIGYLGWRNRRIYDYGISPNKLPEYLAAGLPILHAYSGKDDPIKALEAGITVLAESPKNLAEAILYYLETFSFEKVDINNKRLKIIGKRYSYTVLVKTLEKML